MTFLETSGLITGRSPGKDHVLPCGLRFDRAR
jgi:hypothetical protein